MCHVLWALKFHGAELSHEGYEWGEYLLLEEILL